MRKLETNVPELLEQLVATLCTYDAASCVAALQHAADLYRQLREELADAPLQSRLDAERHALAFPDGIREKVSRAD